MKPQDFITEHEFIGDDAHQMHKSQQHHMLREECYHSAANAIKLHQLLGKLPDGHELDAWAAEKISLANDYLKTVVEWLEYDVMSGERPHASGMTVFNIAEAEEKFAELLGESDAERAYVCVHAKKGQCEVTAKTSYEAARKAAAKWKLKNTAGVDAHLKDVKHRAVNEEQGVEEGLDWETRHDEFVTVGDRATAEQIDKIVKALIDGANQANRKRGFLNQIVGNRSNGDLARQALAAENLAKSIQKNSNAKPGTDQRKELGQHLVYAVSLLKRMSSKQGVAEATGDIKFDTWLNNITSKKQADTQSLGLEDIISAIDQEVADPGQHIDTLYDVLNRTRDLASPNLAKARQWILRYAKIVTSGRYELDDWSIDLGRAMTPYEIVTAYDLIDFLQHAASVLEKDAKSANGKLNEFAPGGEGNNGPLQYGTAIVEFSKQYSTLWDDEASAEDGEMIKEVGETFLHKGMTAGIAALFDLDTQVSDDVLHYLDKQGFDTQKDIHTPYQAALKKPRRGNPGGISKQSVMNLKKMQADFNAQPGQVYDVKGYFGQSGTSYSSATIKALNPQDAEEKFKARMKNSKFSKIEVVPAGKSGVAEGNGPQSKIDQQIIDLLVKGVPAATIARKLDIPEEWVHEVHEYSMPEPSADFSDPRNVSPTNRFGEGVAEALGTSPDRLRARTGMNTAHKFPRPGQTDLGNIPGMNTPGASPETKEFADQQRARRSGDLKAAIKGQLGQHRKPNLPESGVAEATGDPKFDKMFKGITGKKAVAKQRTADTKQQSKDAFDSMFGGGNPAANLGVKKPGVSEDRTETKDKDGNVTSWRDEGPWKPTNPKKNPQGKVHNLTGQALKKTKELPTLDQDLDRIAETFSSSISTAITPGSGPGTGTLFGGTYKNPSSPFRKKSVKKESMIKR